MGRKFSKSKKAGTGRGKPDKKEQRVTDLKLSEFLDAMLDAVLVVNREGRIVSCNSRGEKMFGYGPNELRDAAVEILLPDRLRDLHPRHRGRYVADPTPRPMGVGLNLIGRRKDGSEFPLDISLGPLEMPGGVITIAVVREMTERKLASERQYEELLNSVSAVAWEGDAETRRFFFVSPFAEQLLGYPLEQWLAEPTFWLDHVHPDDRDRAVEASRKTAVDRKPQEMEYRMLASDGRSAWLRDTVNVIVEGGSARKLRGLIRDVSDVKSLEQELELSKRRLQLFFTSAPVGLAIMDSELRFLQINKTLANIHGLGVEEHLGKTVREVLPRFAQVLEPVFQRILATGEPVLNWEKQGETPAQPGVVRDWVASHFPVPGAEGKPYLGAIVVETTEQKRAEEVVRKQAQLLDLAQDAIMGLDLNGTITYWNQGAERLYGWARDEAQGKTMSGLLHPVFPAPADEIMRLLLQEGYWEGEVVQTKRDGVQITVESHCTLQRDEHGEPLAILDISKNITKRKQAEAEIRQLSGRLMNVQDEERRNIARALHDTTAQSLVSLSLNLAVLSKSATLDEAGRRLLSESLSLAQQSTQEVRTLSYLLHPPLLDEAGLVSALRWYVAGFTERSGIDVTLEASPDFERLPREMETMLFRVVQECLTNIHRHSGSPTATIRIGRDPGRLLLEIEDKGRGMSSAAAHTHEGGVLLGVGIAGMRERLTQFGGQLEIHSSSHGTMVRAILPLQV